MMIRRFASVLFGMIAIAMLSFPASAQGMDSKEILATVAFEFYVGDTPFPSGSYSFSARNIGADGVMMRRSDDQSTTTVSIVTRLARREGPAQAPKSNLVFDKVGERRFLSEVWMPGRDGYLVRAKADNHEHVLVDAVK